MRVLPLPPTHESSCGPGALEAGPGFGGSAPPLGVEEESLSYRKLNERAHRLAYHPRRHGAGPEVRVGLCMERGLEMEASLPGVRKAGGAPAPGSPAQRLEWMLVDSGAAPLLTHGMRPSNPRKEMAEASA